MINFYNYYNKTGLDNEEEYSQLIEMLDINEYWDVLKPVEHIIKRNSAYAFRYARDVLKERWPEVEPVIMKSPRYSYCYARGVLKSRWIEAEPYIQRSPLWWGEYRRWFNSSFNLDKGPQ
jgi:hypothetical protein